MVMHANEPRLLVSKSVNQSIRISPRMNMSAHEPRLSSSTTEYFSRNSTWIASAVSYSPFLLHRVRLACSEANAPSNESYPSVPHMCKVSAARAKGPLLPNPTAERDGGRSPYGLSPGAAYGYHPARTDKQDDERNPLDWLSLICLSLIGQFDRSPSV